MHSGGKRKCQELARKKKQFKEWIYTKSVELRLVYWEVKREVKRVVNKVKVSNYKELYSRLDTNERKNKVYGLEEGKERKIRNLINVRCIK